MKILFFVVFLLLLFNGSISRSIHLSSGNDGPPKRINEVKTSNEAGALNKSAPATFANHSFPYNRTAGTSATNGQQNLTEKKNIELFQGDIRLTEMQWNIINKKSNSKYERKTMKHGMEFLWSLPIAYVILPEANESAIEAGIAIWQSETCLKFKRHDTVPEGPVLRFINGTDCSSQVGKTEYIPQDVSIGVGCTSLHTVSHEIGHALGLWHEQSREDRDKYVSLELKNVSPNMTFNYKKEIITDNYGVSYDYGSVMHYNPKAFTVDSSVAITTKDKNYQTLIGHAPGPSFADIKKINLAYCTSTCNTPLKCRHAGYVNPNDCGNCKCPVGLGGKLCETAATSSPECAPGNLNAGNVNKSIEMSGNYTCNFLIEAPSGSKVFFDLKSSSLDCSNSFVSVNYQQDFSSSAAKFCSPTSSTVTLSKSNFLIVIYKGDDNSRATLIYRAEPPSKTKPTNPK